MFGNKKTIHFSPDKLEDAENIVSDFEGGTVLTDIVKVYDVSRKNCRVYNDMTEEHLMITI